MTRVLPKRLPIRTFRPQISLQVSMATSEFQSSRLPDQKRRQMHDDNRLVVTEIGTSSDNSLKATGEALGFATRAYVSWKGNPPSLQYEFRRD